MTPASASRATAVGASAILIWSTMAALTASVGTVPPFQMTALAFLVASALAALKWAVYRQNPLAVLRQPLSVWAVSVAGLFGFHFFYFLAFRLAPPVEASLITYLWPLLIVLFSGLLPGERLRAQQLLGALLGLAGTAVLVLKGGSLGFRLEHAGGYVAALGAALSWSSYSVLNRRFAHVPTDAVGGFCAVTALLAGVCHLIFERTAMPTPGEWLAIVAMGCGPVGAAFFVWDYGTKHGNLRALGIMSYAAPLLSTLLLVALGRAEASATVAIACLLIVGGAALGGLRRSAPDTLERTPT